MNELYNTNGLGVALGEVVYECNAPRGYALKRELRKCSLCRRIIADKKFICVIIQKYDIRDYFHFNCYIRKLEIDFLIDDPFGK